MNKFSYGGPIVLAILDGVGLAPDGPGNAVSRANTPWLAHTVKNYPHIALNASGGAVGLIDGQMGNSEVGHNTMGAGKIVRQGIAQINDAFDTGAVFETEAWKTAMSKASHGKATLHFAGIFSDGGVHSDIGHLSKMITEAAKEQVTRIRIHPVFDGRDVGPYSAIDYVKEFDDFAHQPEFEKVDIHIADGGGRMVYVADRYENDWQMVARGWDVIVNGHADYYFKTPLEAVKTLRRLHPDIQDQNLPPFVIESKDGNPVGKVKQGDVFIYFDFRADRAVEIAEAFTFWDFPHFNRGNYKPTDVYFIGMTEYNSDLHVPEHRLVEPVKFGETLPQFLGTHQISQLAVSETVKFGHVTYYFNGNSYDKNPLEEHLKIDSYPEPFEARPWMRSAEITDAVINNLDKYKFIRLNYPGGDMVGHTANLSATIAAMEAIDLQLARLAAAVDKQQGALIVVADHGNAEELLDPTTNQPKTAHTTNKVPCLFYDNTPNKDLYKLKQGDFGLANLAATIATLLNQKDLPSDWKEGLLDC